MFHVVEGYAESSPVALHFGGSLIDELFQSGGGFRALREQLIELHGIAPEYLDRSAHRGNLVSAGGRNCDLSPSRGDGEHCAAQIGKARHDAPANVQPNNQKRADDGKKHDR